MMYFLRYNSLLFIFGEVSHSYEKAFIHDSKTLILRNVISYNGNEINQNHEMNIHGPKDNEYFEEFKNVTTIILQNIFGDN